MTELVEHRATSAWNIKEITEGREFVTVRGIATTPTTDRMDDIVESSGARFAKSIPLLWQHQADKPVGTVELKQLGSEGIQFIATLPIIQENGTLKDRITEAVQSIKHKLVANVSIGFRVLNDAVERMKNGGRRFKEFEIVELSLVTIGANPQAVISTVKALDPAAAASGPMPRTSKPLAGVTALNSKGKSVNIQEQIKALEAQHASLLGQQTALMDKARGEGRTLDTDEGDTFDGLTKDAELVIADLGRLRAMEKAVLPKATPVAGGNANDGSNSRAGVHITAGRPQVPKGTAFVRYVGALAFAKLHDVDPIRVAQRWKDSTPEVIKALEMKADVGTTTDADWAAPLVYPANLASEFLEILTPMTVMGRLSLTKVPFNVRIPIETDEPLVNWVGEALPKPVGQGGYDSLLVGYNKIAGIVVISEELARLSSPSAEALLSQRLTRSISKFMDQQFLDPAITATSARPASVTNTATAIPASGTDAAAMICDLQTLQAAFLADNQSLSGVVLVMSDVLGSSLGLMRNALGQPEFPGMGAGGGTLPGGLPVITSQNVPTGLIVAIKQTDIFLADDGGVRIDTSREATLSLTGTATADHNLWQHNEVALRAERWVTWKKARDSAVQYISGAAYSTCAP